MARFRSSVPALAVYLVKFASMARCAAAPMCAGVGKSGSPAPKSTTSTPCALSFKASAATFIVGETPIRLVRSASITSGPQCFPRELFLAQPLFHALGDQPVHRSTEGNDFLYQPGADICVRLRRHHADRF